MRWARPCGDRSQPNHPRRHPDSPDIRRNVVNHNGSGANRRGRPDHDPLDDRDARTQVRSLFHPHLPREDDARSEMDMVADPTVMIQGELIRQVYKVQS